MNDTKLTIPADRPVILIERWFEAPRHLVWKAVTTPALVKRWFAPPCTETISCEMDVRVGGRWRIVVRSEPHGDAAFSGVYREITPLERVVQTAVFELFPDSTAIETARYVADGDRTKLELEIVHPSFATRDAQVASGFENGMRQAHSQLETIACSL